MKCNKKYPAATNTHIRTFEEKYHVRLCDDYKQFLRDYNGLYIYWWQLSGHGLNTKKVVYISDKHGFEQKHYPFFEDLGLLEEGQDWIYDVRALLGMSNGEENLDLNEFDMSAFYHKNLVKYVYPIGEDGGGNIFANRARPA